MVIESSLLDRISRSIVLSKEAHKNLWYAEYLVTKRYFGLTQEDKRNIGKFIGLTEKLDKEHDEKGLINIRVWLANYINKKTFDSNK